MKFATALLALTLFCAADAAMGQPAAPVFNIWRVDFDDWVDDSLHWNAPSYVELNENDGSMVFFAKHLANMRREGFFDQGMMRSLHVTLEFFASEDCKGEHIGVDERVVLPGIGYKSEYDDYLRAFGGTPEKARLYQAAKCVLTSRSWEHI